MRRPYLALALCAGLVAACGGDDEEEGKGQRRGQRAVTVPSGQDVRVVGDEYLFAPKRVVVVGGRERAAEVTLRFKNAGTLAHNLKVFRGDEEIGGTPTFRDRQVRSARVRLVPGDYRMVCTVGNHAELGMVGELEVRAPTE